MNADTVGCAAYWVVKSSLSLPWKSESRKSTDIPATTPKNVLLYRHTSWHARFAVNRQYVTSEIAPHANPHSKTHSSSVEKLLTPVQPSNHVVKVGADMNAVPVA